MGPQIALAKAARLAGVSRAKIQKQIEAGKLQAFEGKVLVSQLLELYPHVRMKDDSMLDKVAQIQAKAVSRRRRDADPIDPKTLTTELKKTKQELLFYRQQSERYEDILEDLTGMLERMIAEHDIIARSHLQSVLNWARQKQLRRD